MGLLGRNKKGDDDLGGDPFADSGGGDPFGESKGFDDDSFGGPNTSMNQQSQNQFQAQTLPNHIDTNNPDFNQQMGIAKPEVISPSQDFFRQGQQQNMAGQSSGNNFGSSDEHIGKDLQIIIAKLDALKSELDSIHQRVQKIEKIAETDQQLAIEQKKQQTYRRW